MSDITYTSPTTAGYNPTFGGDSYTIGTTMSYCAPCGSWWYGSYGGHHCYHATAHEHDFEQAREPYEGILFCRKCGETQKLRLPKVKP